MQNVNPDRTWPAGTPWWLSAIVAVSLLAGLYGRFKGLGIWPLGVDEFYISRSIDNALRTGLPEFLCGGFYTRGLLYQYLVALLRIGGITPELAGRAIAALSSLCVLPAAYLLGRRLHGKTAGLLVVAMLSVSVWEIEMARFARMYAPFQAVFAWYLVFFLRHVVDHKRGALLPMVLLSLLGVVTWEGGALLGLLNLLPPFLNHDRGRLRRGDWKYLSGMVVLFVVLYASTMDLRGLADTPALPETTGSGVSPAASESRLVFLQLLQHQGWIIAALIPLCLGAASLAWLWSLRGRWLVASGLAVAMAAALLGQLLLCSSIVVLLLIVQLINWRELSHKKAIPFVLTLAASGCWWLAFSWLTAAGPGAASRMAMVISEVAGFPDLFNQIVRPWGGVLPALSIGLFAGLSLLAFRIVFDTQSSNPAIAPLLTLLLVLGLVIGAASTPRFETRYTFFLYPLLLTLGVVSLALLVDWLQIAPERKAMVLASAGLLLFAGCEDFQPRHIATIDSRETNFRAGIPQLKSAHYYPRNDSRAIAEWLEERVQPGDIVLNGIPNVDQYYATVDYVYLDDEDDRFDAFACQRGTVDRWTNRPLLYGTDTLAPLVATGSRIYIVIYGSYLPRIVDQIRSHGWPYKHEEPPLYGGAEVLVLNPG